MKYKFDIERCDLYLYKEPSKRTRERLIEIAELGLEEIGFANFGIPGIVSGLYIEMVWNFDEGNWYDYIKWIKTLVIKQEIKTGFKIIDDLLSDGIKADRIFDIYPNTKCGKTYNSSLLGTMNKREGNVLIMTIE